MLAINGNSKAEKPVSRPAFANVLAKVSHDGNRVIDTYYVKVTYYKKSGKGRRTAVKTENIAALAIEHGIQGDQLSAKLNTKMKALGCDSWDWEQKGHDEIADYINNTVPNIDGQILREDFPKLSALLKNDFGITVSEKTLKNFAWKMDEEAEFERGRSLATVAVVGLLSKGINRSRPEYLTNSDWTKIARR